MAHPHFSRERLPERGRFHVYRKIALTSALRIEGPFEVETREGVLVCEDGYLAIDAHGWPYPIAVSEFEKIYEPAD
jgi:hypothetical protein